MQNIYHDFDGELYSFYRLADGFDPGYLHFHSHFELSVVKSGSLTIINNGDTLKCDGPCILAHRPNTFHTVIAAHGVPYEIYVFHFNEGYLEEFSSRILDIGPLYRRNLAVIPISDDVRTELYPLLSLYSNSTPDTDSFKRLLLALILSTTLKYSGRSLLAAENASACVKRDNKCGYIGDVIKYISENFSQQLSAEELSKRFFVSTQKLRSDFKQVTLLTLKQYIIDVRITNAIRLLSSGESLLDTAYACGFINESHFIKTFRARIGVSPYRYSKLSGTDKN